MASDSKSTPERGHTERSKRTSPNRGLTKQVAHEPLSATWSVVRVGLVCGGYSDSRPAIQPPGLRADRVWTRQVAQQV